VNASRLATASSWSRPPRSPGNEVPFRRLENCSRARCALAVYICSGGIGGVSTPGVEFPLGSPRWRRPSLFTRRALERSNGPLSPSQARTPCFRQTLRSVHGGHDTRVVAATFLLRRNQGQLIKFYTKVRRKSRAGSRSPSWPEKCPSPRRPGPNLLSWILGCVFIYSALSVSVSSVWPLSRGLLLAVLAIASALASRA